MQREGESGHKKINWYTRILTVIILLFQAPAYLINLKTQAAGALATGVGWTAFMFPASIILAAGSMFILWLGERITDNLYYHYGGYYRPSATSFLPGS
jgi:preprotein translocase subunit SecY